MTGKLIKYEIRSMIRQMGLIWAAPPVLALVWAFTNKLSSQSIVYLSGAERFVSVIQVVSTFVYAAVFAIMLVATVVIILQRFYKGLLRDEGYLMHTLPVKPWQLITSKGIVAAIVVLVSGIAATLSVFILLIAGSSLGEFMNGLGNFMSALRDNPRYILYVLEIIFIVVISILKSIYQMYASMAIGQLASNHKLLMSVVAYIGISTVLSILVGLFTLPINERIAEAISNFFLDMSTFAAGQFGFFLLFLIIAVQLVLFHVITERLLTKKLNLE